MEEARGPVVLGVWSRGSVLAELAVPAWEPGAFGWDGRDWNGCDGVFGLFALSVLQRWWLLSSGFLLSQ